MENKRKYHREYSHEEIESCVAQSTNMTQFFVKLQTLGKDLDYLRSLLQVLEVDCSH